MVNAVKIAPISFNPFPDKPWFSCVCSTSILKTRWEKEKLLVIINFSFSHTVFYPFGELPAIFIKFKIVICKLFQFGRVYNLLSGKGLNKYNLLKISLKFLSYEMEFAWLLYINAFLQTEFTGKSS